MTQYLVAIHLPDDFDRVAAEQDEAMNRDIDALNQEMKAAGVRYSSAGWRRQAGRRRCGRRAARLP